MKIRILVVAAIGLVVIGVLLRAELGDASSQRGSLGSGTVATGVADSRNPGAPAVPLRIERPPTLPRPPHRAAASPESTETDRTRDEQRDAIEAHFRSERMDGAASAADTRRLEQALPGALPTGSSLRAVECRSTLCRIETGHTDLASAQEFLQRAFVAPDTAVLRGPGVSRISNELSASEPFVAVAYVARDGKPLPTTEIP
jgi:hypothetical protein